MHADEADSLEEGDRESLDEQDEGELDPVRLPQMPRTRARALAPLGNDLRGHSGPLVWDCPYAAQDSMTYEQLCALGDAVGTHSRGDRSATFLLRLLRTACLARRRVTCAIIGRPLLLLV